jgi:multiple sugar transport system substrate-binding protein
MVFQPSGNVKSNSTCDKNEEGGGMVSGSSADLEEREKIFRVAIRKFDPFAAAIAKQWAAFQAAEGVDLTLEAIELDLHPLYESYFDLEGLKGGVWDVGFMVSDWFAAAYESGAVLDIGPLLASDPPDDYPLGWTPSLLGIQRFDSGDANAVIVGLPYHDGPECLIYRKDLFENPQEQAAYLARYGVPLRVPETWEEFQQIARFFHRPQEGLYGTVFAAYPDGHNTVYDFCLQLWTRGGELFDQAGKLLLDTPQAVAALEFYRAILNDEAAIHPQARQMDSVQSGLAFAAGEVAMMINWFGFAAMAETIESSKVKGCVDVATIPHGVGSASASLNVYWILCIAAGSPHAAIAYRFLRFCAAAAMDRLLTLEGGIGCRKSTWADAEVNAAIPFYHKMEGLHGVARELPRLSQWAQIATVIDGLVLAAINGDQPVAELVQAAQPR